MNGLETSYEMVYLPFQMYYPRSGEFHSHERPVIECVDISAGTARWQLTGGLTFASSGRGDTLYFGLPILST